MVRGPLIVTKLCCVTGEVHMRSEGRVPEFVIHELAVGGGTLALSPIPGRTRHYATDRERLLDWRPALVLTLTTEAELRRKGAGGLPEDLAAAGIVWRHLPIADFGVPGPAVDVLWPDVAAEVLAILGRGGRVLVHCHGGCGRSGMAVLRLMIAAGEGADIALARLRAVRPCAVETEAQMLWAVTASRR
jgi:hypothetical protein